jgi:hypothetical protein
MDKTKRISFGRKRRRSGKKRREKSAWRCTTNRFLLMVSENDIFNTAVKKYCTFLSNAK